MRRALSLAIVAACSSHVKAPPSPAPRSPAPPPPTVAPAPDPTPPPLRLPGDVTPVRVALELTIDPSKPTFTGHVRIDATVTRATRVVWLNATGLTITAAHVGGKDAGLLLGSDDFVGLALDTEVAPGPTVIDVVYSAPIDRDRSRGVYAVTEGGEPYVYTFFEPIDARRAFPGFDEPSAKVPWQLTFHVRKGDVALGNAPVASETVDGDVKTVVLAETKPLPSYLVAFMVGPFEIVDDGTAGRAHTPIRFVIPRGRAGELDWAKEITPRVVAALEDYFDMAYPYGKLDVAVVPRYWGTMEHPGIVAMGQPLTLIRPEQATRGRKQAYANILSHELSHYWFGDLVTMAWWDDTWLNEALGEWSDMNITEAVEPAWRYRDERVRWAAFAMDADETPTIHAIRAPVDSKERIQASFDNGITYFKGASVFRMFEAYVGRDVWQKFIRAYLKQYAWGNASADDFIAVMRRELGGDVADAFRTFLDQPGLPVIAHEVACSAGGAGGSKIVLHQKRALPAGAAADASTWRVPVCVRWGDDKGAHRACTLLTAADGEIATGACPRWVIANADATGYYRSAITRADALALLGPRAPATSAAERMMLARDVVDGVKRGELALDDALAVIPRLAADKDDKVAATALAPLELIHAEALDDTEHARYERFVLKAFGAQARALGWARRPGDSDERQDLRRRIVPMVAIAGDEKLAAEGARRAARWLKDRKGLDDDLVGGALSVAARRGDAAFLDGLIAAAKGARDRTEQQRLLGAIGEVIDPALGARALALVLGHDFDLRESLTIVYGQLFQRETRTSTWVWLEAHVDDLFGRMRDDEAAGFMYTATAFCDRDHRDRANALLAPRAAHIDGAQNSLGQALQAVDDCAAELARDRQAIDGFLAGYAK